MLSLGDINMELRRITILERNSEYHDAAEQCFALYKRTQTSDLILRGFKNIWASAWHAQSLSKMKATLSEFLSRFKQAQEKSILTPEQTLYLNALSLEAKGWLAEPPNPDWFIEAVQGFIEINEIHRALNLITSLLAFVQSDQQIHWSKYGIEIAEQLDTPNKDAYYLLLVEPLLLYAERAEKEILLHEIFHRTNSLSQVKNRTPIGNIAVLQGVDLLHPFQTKPDVVRQIRQDNTHELVRSLVDITENRTRGIIQSLLGSSYYRMAEAERDPELRQDLYEKAKDHFLHSVSTLERTPAYGDLLRAYTLAGTGFLSIAELEQDFDRRNKLFTLGEEYLRKSRTVGEMTQLHQLRARASINLGVALERVTWFDMNLDSRREKLMEIYHLQLEGRDLAEKTKGLRGAGYAIMNASEMCGFLSDLETRTDKKLEWANKQRELSQKGLELLNQTKDIRGQVVSLSYAAFACAKLADLTPAFEGKTQLYEEMLQYCQNANILTEQVPDPVATAYAFQQAGDAAQHLGILKGDVELIRKAASFYEKASETWSKTGERHKRAKAITLHADSLLFQSSLDFTPNELERAELLEKSEQLHQEAANHFSKLFFYHDVGENYWRIGQIYLLKHDYVGAQEYFDRVQKAFDKASELIPELTDVYSLFSTFGTTFVGLVDGLHIISRDDYAYAALLLSDLAKGLETETERSLRQLRQLLIALANICQFADTKEKTHREKARIELERLLNQLTSDAYHQQLPYSLHKTIHRLQIFLVAPRLFFPPLLLDLPLQEKMLAMAQTRHIVSTALSIYKTTASHREIKPEEPTEDFIRSYVARLSNLLSER